MDRYSLYSQKTRAALAACLLFSIAHSTGCSQASATAKSAQQPALSAQQDSWDFGIVDVPQTLQHVFTLENKSDHSIPIEKPIAACSCTVVDNPKAVDAHSTAPITMSVKTSMRQGSFATYVDIVPASPEIRPVRLRVTFFGRPKSASDPQKIVTSQSVHSGHADVSFRLFSKIDDTSGISVPLPEFRYSGEALQSRVERVITSPHIETGLRQVEYRCRCSIDLDAISATKEKRSTQNIVVSGLPYQVSDLTIPVTVESLDHPLLSGPELLFVSRSRKESAELSAKIWSIDGQPLRIDRIATSNDLISATITPSSETSSCDLMVRTRPLYWSNIDKPAKEQISIYTAGLPSLPYKIELQMLP
jgi:hypothetical protein